MNMSCSVHISFILCFNVNEIFQKESIKNIAIAFEHFDYGMQNYCNTLMYAYLFLIFSFSKQLQGLLQTELSPLRQAQPIRLAGVK